jgi:hypothetical protein
MAYFRAMRRYLMTMLLRVYASESTSGKAVENRNDYIYEWEVLRHAAGVF